MPTGEKCKMGRLRKGKRDRKRINLALPVRVWTTNAAGDSQSEPARTVDITPQGARFGGIWNALTPDGTIEVQHHDQHARFRVVWVTCLADSQEKQVGAECLEPDKNLWKVELPKDEDFYDSPD